MDATPANRWVRHAMAGLARTVLATLAGLLIWTALPALLGWQPSVVLSGSMEPAIRVGDVVLTREVAADDLRPGHVLLVDDPDKAGRRLMHRYDHMDHGGGLVLRGDANAQEDSTPVPYDQVRGVGVLRVPWVGLPYVWAVEGRYLTVGLAALGLLTLIAVSPIRERRGDAADEAGDNTAETTRPRATGRHAAVASAALLLALGTADGLQPASATFTDTTTVSASFTAGYWAPEAALGTAGE